GRSGPWSWRPICTWRRVFARWRRSLAGCGARRGWRRSTSWYGTERVGGGQRKMDEDARLWVTGLGWFLALPTEREVAIRQELQRLDKEDKMPYLSFIERYALEKGREEGIEKGREEGALMGQVQLCQELLKQPPTPQAELLALSQEELAALLTQLRKQLL